MTQVDTEEEFRRAEIFQRKFIPGTRAQLRVLHQSYQVRSLVQNWSYLLHAFGRFVSSIMEQLDPSSPSCTVLRYADPISIKYSIVKITKIKHQSKFHSLRISFHHLHQYFKGAWKRKDISRSYYRGLLDRFSNISS